jgi:hypothetical protein
MDRNLGRSDPRLASEMWAFGRITSGQAMPYRERIQAAPEGPWRVVFRPVSWVAHAVLVVAGVGAARARRAAVAWRSRSRTSWAAPTGR